MGSFLNVCIYRLPKCISILSPRSFCTNCNNKIAWYDNIPILSYLILGGRCRNCKSKISIQYIFVELFSGLITGWFYYFFIINGNKSLESVISYILLSYALVVITFIDIKYLIIPNTITYSGILIVAMLSIIFPGIYDSGDYVIHYLNISRIHSFISCILGMSVSGGLIFLTVFIGRYVFKKEAMGVGDAKLMCMIGGVIGWKLGIVVFFVAPFFGLFAAIPMWITKKTQLIPYAPFLSLATLIVISFQDYFVRIIETYIILFA